jgi:quercetin dioxygenase-like cupin family protein
MATLSGSKAVTLAKTADLELIPLVLPAGKKIRSRKAPGEITVQRLKGRVAFTVQGQNPILLYLSAAEPHAVKAIEAYSLLVTILLGKK